MIRSLQVVAIFPLLLFVIGGTEAGVMHADPENLVSFTVPDGWAKRSDGNGIRFGRADAAAERTVLAVSARPRDPNRDINAQRAITHAQIKQQGFNIVIDRIQQISGWEALEVVMDASTGGKGPIMHTFHMFSKDIQAEVLLIAAKADYPKYQKDLLAVVQSLRKR